ncbi:Plasmid maintenance system antidote protein [Caenispirillum salinarum AK4]|uniref:Plasmid maintenance system antidote protein n=1 Tax=Caenispirillum salinarum AK4 TaxID=1238182 RepID=K9GW44_9PROT|nr:Plasmid maintenance system antidote protein [Caenispirillum salinarum AK4]
MAEYYLKPKGITQTDFAAATGLTRKHISSVIHGRASITPDTAVRFAEVLGTSPEYWLNLQTAVALWDARQALKDDPSIQRRRFAGNGDDGPAA